MVKEDNDIEKKYYSIGEVAQLFDVAPSLIRFWESHFDVIKPRKTKNGTRQYTKEDIDNLQTIYFLVKKKGYTLQGAKEVLQSKPQITENMVQIINALEDVKLFLEELKEKLK
ncbi:MAG: MerR family transcriptional regulator [Thermoflexibacter sp.]|jgi:DNA-binding transcriptional MerR regulator|nr:MerR family transcriptional regulator [Thermoflexibacter sp.]